MKAAKFANARTLSPPRESPAPGGQAVHSPNPTICKSLSPQLSRAESPSEPRLLPGSVVYFFLGAAFGVEACCCFF